MERDAKLVALLSGLHCDRATEDIDVAVVYGAAHLPAVSNRLSELGCRPQRGAKRLTVIAD